MPHSPQMRSPVRACLELYFPRMSIMAYQEVYFHIQTYAYGYDSGWSSEADEAAFDNECRSLFQQLGWTLHPGSNGVCDTAAKDRQDLYLHPTSFSGVMDEANIQPLQEQAV